MTKTLDVDSILSVFRGDFESRPTYFAARDCIQFYFEDADGFADWVNGWLTLYRAFDDNRIIGFMLENASVFFAASRSVPTPRPSS